MAGIFALCSPQISKAYNDENDPAAAAAAVAICRNYISFYLSTQPPPPYSTPTHINPVASSHPFDAKI
jgi:hypothetical protein